MLSSLLPTHATEFEKRLADVCVFHQDVDGSISGISHSKLITRPPRFLPWLIEEYGLGELTPYVPNLYDLLDQGLQWQRIHGSLAAIDQGLQWLGLSVYFTPAWSERVWWNSFQLELDRLPEQSDLESIEAIVDLFKSLRSDFAVVSLVMMLGQPRIICQGLMTACWILRVASLLQLLAHCFPLDAQQKSITRSQKKKAH